MACVLLAAALPLSALAQGPPVEVGDDKPVPAGTEPRCAVPCVGPVMGSLVLAGGGELDPSIFRRFVQLAGGSEARILVIPTATRYDEFDAGQLSLRAFEEAGVEHIEILHTRSRSVADSEAFVEPLRKATGVWILGGRTWRLVDPYLDTRTEQELHLLLARGGVIGGTSAGASIMASYLVRGAVPDNEIVLSPPKYERGFGFLRVVAVDQHLLARNRELDMLEVLAARPELLGIGLDEGTALVVQEDRAEVIGVSGVSFYDPHDTDDLFQWLAPGEVYDLSHRAPVGLILTTGGDSEGH